MPAAALYQDADLFAVHKPAGVTVVPARGEPPAASLAHQLAAERGERVWVVHRLDRDTSGVVVFARNADAHRALNRAFEERRVEKRYLAFVAGRLHPGRGRIDLALHGARRGKARPALPGEPGGQVATTDYLEERAWQRDGVDVSRLCLEPRTGRHHQIRVHLRSRGTPVLFDPLYGGTPHAALAGAPCRRLALHAARISLPTPAGPLSIEAPLPADLAALEAWLDAGGDS